MADDFYLLSENDLRILREVIRQQRLLTANPRLRHSPELDQSPAPDTYVARIPPQGIPPPIVVGTGTGSISLGPETTFNWVMCPVYQLRLNPNNTANLIQVSALHKVVYALSEIQGDTWRMVGRDKYGTWWVLETAKTAIARINSGPNGDGLYDATLQYYDPFDRTWLNGPNIWLKDANS